MRSDWSLRVASAAAALAAFLAFPACTLVGAGIGHFADRGKPPKLKPVAVPEIQSLKPGTVLEVHMRDGRTLAGPYAGLSWASLEDYAPRYEAAGRALAGEATLPALGPGARLALTNDTLRTGDYLGIGPGFVSFREPSQAEAVRVDLQRVASLTDADGRRIAGNELRALALASRLPLLAGLRLGLPGDPVVPFEEVTSVSRSVKRSGTKTGLLIGLVADVALVIALVADSSSSPEPCTCQPNEPCYCDLESCPLIDSFDGRRYVLDAEPLGGATYEAARRADTVALEHLVATDNEYRLRLHNDQNEIDHVDALALRVVDHAPGARIVPDDQGRLHAIRATRAPDAAADRRGARIGTLLSRSDGRLWVSNPFVPDAGVAADPRDGVDLQFARPRAARSATLVVRAGATALGSLMLAAALRLHGRELPAFYAQLNGDPALRGAFEAAREREVLPSVRVWDGQDWTTIAHVRNLPSLLTRDQAVPLDLVGLPEGPLRIRIDGPPGFWVLDRVAVSWSASEVPSSQEQRLAVDRAKAEDGRDLGEVLRDTDGRRHTLRPGHDSVTLAFRVPPRRPGLARSVLLEATGYYVPILPAEGEPQRAAFRRLVEEPGAVARFTLDWLRVAARDVAVAREF